LFDGWVEVFCLHGLPIFYAMNIREALLEDKTQNRTKALSIARYACSSPQHFGELMACFTDTEYRLAQRAAWSVSWAARQEPAMVKPYIKTLVDQLERTDVHPAVIRNSVRVLQGIDIPQNLHGKLMHACFRFVENPTAPGAIKAFSLTILYNLSLVYPDIQPELALLIRERWDTETPAFRVRARQVLQNLEKAPRHIVPRKKIR
jgi:hypothetical protein